MLETTLHNIIKTLTVREDLNNYQVNQLKNQVKLWKKDTIIYPGMFKSKLNINISKAYDMLEFLKSQKILERNYEVYCKECHRFKGVIIRTPSEYKRINMYCDFCNNELVPLDDSIVIYRVILDE
ncbi:Uncharacterised protein [[Clostridium] sordellii]|uniref:hypothetical protein n=1 Tax=Paraclostridium sordellii TaxID=1505 RepID=UPI0005EA647A|nr:hypothetical protein [Paeniclostridium sordellii]CEP79244.1 Uncharacterised protein [[Clostridium] sordellii] [Paeniclostridium sordellii]